MAVKPNLRAVGVDEKPPVSAQPKTVTEASKGGSIRELLVATRDRIAIAVEDERTPARDLAALSKRLMDTAREIEAIDARSQESDSSAEVNDGEFDAEAI